MGFRAMGVKRPKISPELADRVPPGQHVTARWPVLHQGSGPEFDPVRWDLRVFGLVEAPLRFSWDEFLVLPRVQVRADMHCVTRWSTLDNTWEGVPAREILARAGVRPEARFVVFHAAEDYAANIPLAAFDDDDVVLAIKRNGEELTPEHGYPVRAIVPKRYAWKGAKWLRGIEFVAEDQPGFWEQYGYNNSADPWREERFAE